MTQGARIPGLTFHLQTHVIATSASSVPRGLLQQKSLVVENWLLILSQPVAMNRRMFQTASRLLCLILVEKKLLLDPVIMNNKKTRFLSQDPKFM